MKKQILYSLLILATGALLAACSKDEVPGFDGNDNPTEALPSAGFLVVNQGNSYIGVSGTLDRFRFADSTLTSGLFKSTNQMELGNGPQGGDVCGSKAYIAMFDANQVWVMDKTTAEAKTSVAVVKPNAVVANGGYVYVSGNDGYVTRIDTTNFTTSQIAVGPNPVGMTVANGFLYVANSDGYNYMNNYANGKTVSKIDLATFTEVKKINVGLNPTRMVADEKGNVFVSCQGNYSTVAPEVQKITKEDNVSHFAAAGMMAVSGTTLYTINLVTDYTTYTSIADYVSFNTETGDTVSKNYMPVENKPAYPTSIAVDKSRNLIYITSDPSSNGYAQKGYVYIYNMNGLFIKRVNTGIHPVGVILQ